MSKELKITIEGPSEVVAAAARLIADTLEAESDCDGVKFQGSVTPAYNPPAANFASKVDVTIETKRSPTLAFFSAMSKFAKRNPGEGATLTDDEIKEVVAEIQKTR